MPIPTSASPEPTSPFLPIIPGTPIPTAPGFPVCLSEGRSGAGVWIAARATTAQTEAQYHDQIRQTTLHGQAKLHQPGAWPKPTLKLAQDNLSSYRHELQINHDRYDAGDIGKLDYERLDLQLAQFESDESSAEDNLVQASDQLQTLMGIGQPSRSFDVSGDLVPPPLSTKPDRPGAESAGSETRLPGCPGSRPRSRRQRQTSLRQRNDGSHA